MPSFTPTVCMDPTVRFVGQAAAYEALQVGGPLTNRKIAAYIREGRYGPEAQARFERWDALRSRARTLRVLRLAHKKHVKSLPKRVLIEYNV